MSSTRVEKIADAVLYEGYALYPYRASSRKNRSRFTFGRLYPESFSVTQGDSAPFITQTECLLLSVGDNPLLNIRFRFLQPVSREIALPGEPVTSLDAIPDKDSLAIVAQTRIDGKLYQSWQEAVARELEFSRVPVADLLGEGIETRRFSFPTSTEMEPIPDRSGLIRAFICRRQMQIVGLGKARAARIDDQVLKVTVSLENLTQIEAADLINEETILLRTFVSTHAILTASGGEFLSLLDPPADYSDSAASCKNIGLWPVLVGEKNNNRADTLLSSPIILYDNPELAAESPGDLFDNTEIDEILTLRVLTMTDEEKSEMNQLDERTREILERTESMSKADLLSMHGEMRKTEMSCNVFADRNVRPKSVMIEGRELYVGDAVTIRPKGRADVMDLALEGRTAVIESIEQDAEERIYLALVLDEDPGRDLGLAGQPGHRFFYRADEVALPRS